MKRLVICCDGTWNRADQVRDGELCPTNVVKLAYSVAPRDDDDIPQIVYYHHGVGTGNVLDRATGGAFGEGLDENLFAAYRFLIGNFEYGDQIFLFGFSRGAYTARSLGGMIRKCGILRRSAFSAYAQAIEIYRDAAHPDEDAPSAFRQSHSVCEGEGLPIQMIGVWDTVGSLGIPLRGLRSLTRRRYQFHDTALSRSVRYACHALAIDEHRAPFEPTLWALTEKDRDREHAIEQVWFCGAHSDVGGGYPAAGLSDIALEWMLGRAAAAGLHLIPRSGMAFPMRPRTCATVHESRRGMYRLTRGINRSIGIADSPEGSTTGVEDPTQRIHESVLRRWDRDPIYRPAPLRRYFLDTGDPRGRA